MNTIGIVEFKDIPTGIWTLDKVIKNSEVGVYKAGTTCPGKYFFIIYGDNESVKIALNEVEVSLKIKLISGVSKKILEILKGKNNVEIEKSIAIVEYTTISESISSLDHVLKNTDAKVLKLVLGYGIAGKSYYVITGDVSSIEEAVVLITGLSEYKDLKVVNNPSFEMKKYI
jgi:microcompartment protein CcmL/EutN